MNQLQNAQKQLRQISIVELKELLKSNYPAEYSKMIIDDATKIQRVDYYYSKLDYVTSFRKYRIIKFPLFDKIKNNFNVFEGGVIKFGNQSVIEYENFLTEFLIVNGSSTKESFLENKLSYKDYPFDNEEDEVSVSQKKYFIPKDTYQETCTKCSGNKYITCTDSDCVGKHEWKCNKCIGKGQTTCTKCDGHKYNRCFSCSGKGKKTTTEHRNGKSYPKIEQCGSCSGKGEKPCTKCGTTGKLRCSNCSGSGNIVCSSCYSDKARYGTIDCTKCLTAGKTAQIKYLNTDINTLQTSNLLKIGGDFEIKSDVIKNHIDEQLTHNLVYKNINGIITDKSDEISEILLGNYITDLNLSKEDYPLLLKANILYQVIPCLQFSYKHILTNEIHTINLVDIWNNPDLIFQSNAELTKVSITSFGKSVGNLFSKVFKTQGHKLKEDRKIEIKLMIYLAKSDGKIEEEEKIFLSNEIANLKDFTNSEKNLFFDLMNKDVLPELTKIDVAFNDSNRGKDVIALLEKMALADGEYETLEKELIQKLKTLL